MATLLTPINRSRLKNWSELGTFTFAGAIALTVSPSAFSQTASQSTPPQVLVLREVSKEGGCVQVRNGRATLLDPIRSEHKQLEENEREGYVTFRNGRVRLTDDAKRIDHEAMAEGRSSIEGMTRTELLVYNLREYRWEKVRIPGEDRLYPLSDAASREISTAFANAIVTGRIDNPRITVSLLGIGFTTISSRTSRCRPWLTVSPARINGEWAFVETGAVWAPLAAEGVVWALHRDGGYWHVVGRRRKWVS